MSVCFDIMVQLTYKEMETRDRLIDAPQDIVINQYAPFNVRSSVAPNASFSKGMFVMVDCPLAGLSLQCDGMMFINIGKHFFDTYFTPKKCIRWTQAHEAALNDVYIQKKIPTEVRNLVNHKVKTVMRPIYMYWIPFGAVDGSFSDPRFEGLINLVGKNIKLDLAFGIIKPYDDPVIYFVGKNILRVMDGVAGVMFSA